MNDPNADPNALPTAGAAIAAGVPDPALRAEADASAQAAQDQLKSTIDNLVESIKAGAAKIDAAAAPRPVETPVAPTPVFTPETLAEMCEKAGLPREASGVFVEFARNVVAPVYANQITSAARTAKRDAERDPEIGPLMKRYGTRITALITEQGVTDAYLAEHGYEKLARLAASEDPKFLEERVAAEVEKRLKAAPAPAANQVPGGPAVATPSGATPPRPPMEGAAPPSAPTRRAPSSADEAIALVEVSREEVDHNRLWAHMSEGELKKQRYEIARAKTELGPFGLRQVGGVPVCDLDEVFNHPTNPIQEAA